MNITPTAHLRNARGLVANVDGSLAFCIAQDADAGVLAQQVPFVIGELRHAIEHLEEAQAIVSGPARQSPETLACCGGAEVGGSGQPELIPATGGESRSGGREHVGPPHPQAKVAAKQLRTEARAA